MSSPRTTSNEDDAHSDRNSSVGDGPPRAGSGSISGDAAGEGLAVPGQPRSRAARLASAAASILIAQGDDDGELVTRKPPRPKPKRAGSGASPTASPEIRPFTPKRTESFDLQRDSQNASMEVMESEIPGSSLIPQRRVSSAYLPASERISSRSSSFTASKVSLDNKPFDASPSNTSAAPSSAQTVPPPSNLPTFPPLSNPFEAPDRKSLLTEEQEKEVWDAMDKLIEKIQAEGEDADWSLGNDCVGTNTYGSYVFHRRTAAQRATESGEPLLVKEAAPAVQISGPHGSAVTSESPRPPPSPSVRSRPRSEAESINTFSVVGVPDTRGIAENIALPFQRLDNSLNIWLHLNVLAEDEVVLAWIPGSYFFQTLATVADPGAAQKLPDAAEFPGYFLATTTSLKIYNIRFQMPYRETFFESATYRNPSKFVKLHEEIPLASILRIDVALGDQSLVLRCRGLGQQSGSRTQITSYILHLRDPLRGTDFIAALKSVLPGDAKHPIWNEGGWWTGLNAVYDLEFEGENLPLYSSAGFVDEKRELLATCSVLSDGLRLAVCEERWQVWPPLLFPPERLGDKRVWVNELVGKVPKKGLLADVVGQFTEPLFIMPLALFERVEKWPVRQTDIPVFDSWMVQGGLTGKFPPSRTPSKAKASAIGNAEGTATGWRWAVKIFFLAPRHTDDLDEDAAHEVFVTLLFATMDAADRFLGSLATVLNVGWVTPIPSKRGSERARSMERNSEGVMFSKSTNL